ncbi:hypothetical protein [Nocardia sp. NPDC004260]
MGEHRRRWPQRGLGDPAGANDDIGGENIVRGEPRTLAVELQYDLVTASTGLGR